MQKVLSLPFTILLCAAGVAIASEYGKIGEVWCDGADRATGGTTGGHTTDWFPAVIRSTERLQR